MTTKTPAEIQAERNARRIASDAAAAKWAADNAAAIAAKKAEFDALDKSYRNGASSEANEARWER